MIKQPPRNCPRCPRLAAFRREQREAHPDWFNAPVPFFGDHSPWLLIVGLAPGRRGANRTGRPFTGDHAGKLLYKTLLDLGLATGEYTGSSDDPLRLHGCRITNAVRCVPPANRPTPDEISACNDFLAREILLTQSLRAILALGTVAHDAALRALSINRSSHRFAHGVIHTVGDALYLADSYHCSRQNTNTGRLTEAMFTGVFRSVMALAPSDYEN